MEQYKIDRINELAKKAKERPLTDEELKEREVLRKEYIELWKYSLEAQLENTYIIDKDGNKQKLKKRK